MKTSRRTFLKTSALAVAASTLLKQQAFAVGNDRITGLQLYSVRDVMASDPLHTLEMIATMGCVYLEHASYVDRKFYGYPATEFKKILDDLGLKMISGHTVFGLQHWDTARKDFSDSWKYTLEDATILEQKYVISPWMDVSMRNSYDNLRLFLDIFNKNGQLCMKSGMKFGYHNHDFEFSQQLNDQKVFDIMMNHIDPKMVVIQLDIGNMYNGGAKAMDVINQYPGRFENLHVKDEIKIDAEGGNKYESCILGEGVVNCREAVDLATKTGGTTCYIIEQEAYQEKNPMDCVKEDMAVMKKWGYA
jgi:sugar phosphate isomerase/epimerase